MNPQPLAPAPVTPFVFTPAAPRSHQASLTIGLNKLSIKIAHAKYGALTEEQKRSYLDDFAKVCEKAAERWSSISVRNRVNLTSARWSFVVNAWLPQLDSRCPPVPQEQLWHYGVVERTITHYLPATVSLFFLPSRSFLTLPSACRFQDS